MLFIIKIISVNNLEMFGIKLVLIFLKFMIYLILIIGDVIFLWKICGSDFVYVRLLEWIVIVFVEE